MTLGGLALAVGILVDERDGRDREHEPQPRDGKAVIKAILDGAQQIATRPSSRRSASASCSSRSCSSTGVAKYSSRPSPRRSSSRCSRATSSRAPSSRPWCATCFRQRPTCTLRVRSTPVPMRGASGPCTRRSTAASSACGAGTGALLAWALASPPHVTGVFAGFVTLSLGSSG